MHPVSALAAIPIALLLSSRLRFLHPTFSVPDPTSSAVLITGASGGFGAAFGNDLAGLGFVVYGTVRKQADADALAAGGVIRPVVLDVSRPEDVTAAVDRIGGELRAEGRRLSAVVNNAGLTGMDRTRLLKTEVVGAEHYERVFNTNVMGMVQVTEAFLPLLKVASGRVVNIGSYFGSFAPGIPPFAPYIASKHAVEGLTDVWRRALRGAGISVSLVKPGDFSTRMNPLPGAKKDLTPVVEAVRDAITSPSPLARYHVGNVVVKLKGLPVAIACRLLQVVPDVVVDAMLR